MTPTATVLIITSAFLHAFWNFVSKRRSPTLAFFFLAAASGAMVMLPVLIAHRRLLLLIPPSVWLLVTLTGVAQAIYFSGLAGAYRHGDISLAYPLARALPVLSVAAVSFLLGRGTAISTISVVGMVLIAVGSIILPMPEFRRLRLRDYTTTVYRMAVIAAIGTTGYTLLDDAALRQLRTVADLPLSPTRITLLFITFQVSSTALMIGLTTLIRASERQRLARLISDRSLFRMGLLTGVIIMATYGLVLASMNYVRDVSYVAAFRQLSIPIGAILGLTLQGEPRFRPKITGIFIITIGLILVGVG